MLKTLEILILKIFRKNFREYSREYEFGIFQSIGFKEFEDYFKFIEMEKLSSADDKESVCDEKKKNELFEKCINEMKQSTRRYAKTQMKWVRNRFIKSKNLNDKNITSNLKFDNYVMVKINKGADKKSPIVHELDTSDLEKWNENIFEKATNIYEDYLNRFEKNNAIELNKTNNVSEECDIFEYNKCEECNLVFINKNQWNCKK